MTSTLRREVDPHGFTSATPGAKLDHGKPDLSLLLMFGTALSAVGDVATFGAKKYTRGGWQFVPDGTTRYMAAMLRHVFKSFRESHDADSGLHHLAHAAWNSLAILELTLRKEEGYEPKNPDEG